MATDADLLTTHEKEYVEKIKSTSTVSDDVLISMEHGYHNICMHKVSYTYIYYINWTLLQVTPADDADLLTMHARDYVEKVKSSHGLPDDELITMEHGFDSIAFHKVSLVLYIRS